MTHTPTNWYVFTDGPRPFGAAEISATVGDMPVTVGFASVDDARRIVACVNALSGISTEAIEAGAVKGLPQEHWTVEALIVAINALTKAGNDLAFKAEISGGVAGRDDALCDAIAHWAAERDKYRQVIRIVKFEGNDPEIGAGVLAMDPAALSQLRRRNREPKCT